MQCVRANRIARWFFFKRGLGGLTRNVIQRSLYLGGNVVPLLICRTRGGEGSNGSDGRRVCLLEEPINATCTVNEIVTRLLATTGALIKYSRGEEIRNTNRAQTRVVATRRWRRAGLLKIFIFIEALGCSCGSAVVLLLDLAWFLGRR
jgi:hypothetical protein